MRNKVAIPLLNKFKPNDLIGIYMHKILKNTLNASNTHPLGRIQSQACTIMCWQIRQQMQQPMKFLILYPRCKG